MKGGWFVIGLAMIIGFLIWLIEYKDMIPTEVSLAGAGTAKFANKKTSGEKDATTNNFPPTTVETSNKNQKQVNNNEQLNTSNKPYKENFTKSKKGLLVVTPNWKREWYNYLTIYEDFVQLPTQKGYHILNSLNKNDIYDIKNDTFPEVAGYIRTNEGIFYITKHSYNNKDKDGYPKFIEPIK